MQVFFFKGVNKHPFNIYYESDTMQVSVELPMNKIGLIPVIKSANAVVTAQRRDEKSCLIPISSGLLCSEARQ